MDKFIAVQGIRMLCLTNHLIYRLKNILAPTSKTVDDFWRMLIEKNVPAIVMLANFEQTDIHGNTVVICLTN